MVPEQGLSPRRRGEPAGCARRSPTSWVYPRAGGGTTPDVLRAATDKGLSPRRRGNRTVDPGGPDAQGSIPAQAGEPSCSRFRA